MLARFSIANEIQIAALDIIEHGILKVGIGVKPASFGEITIDFRILKHSTMSAEDYPANQFQIFQRQFRDFRRLKGGLRKIIVFPALHCILPARTKRGRNHQRDNRKYYSKSG